MTIEEFTKAALYLSAGIRQMLKPEELDVYFDMLKDLTYVEFMAGVRIVLAEHVWNTFPSIAELRQAAVNSRRSIMSASEAWELASAVASRIDLDIAGPFRVKDENGQWQEWESQSAYEMRNLPEPVVRAMRAYGIREFCYASDPVGVVRGQFFKVFEQLADSEKRREMLPPSANGSLIGSVLKGIGDMPK